MEKMKCAYIFQTQTTKTKGNFSGGAVGLGLSSGGLGIGGGVIEGASNSTSTTQLALMFAPINTSDKYESEGFNPMFLLIVAFGALIAMAPSELSSIFCKNLFTCSPDSLKTIHSFFIPILGLTFMALGCKEFISVKTHKIVSFTDEERMSIENRYHQTWYDPQEHVIFIDENNKLPASRNNFIKLVSNKL